MWHADQEHRAAGIARARRPLIAAAIVGGAILQHILVAAPPQPASLSPTPQAPPTAPARPAPAAHLAPGAQGS